MSTADLVDLPRPLAPPPAEVSRRREDELREVLHTAGFAAVAPVLRRLLDGAAQDGSGAPAQMSRNVSHLQEVFVDALYELLTTEAIDTSHKLALRLNNAGLLHCAGPHPDAERLNTALAARPALSAVFAETAAQSAALRDLYNLHRLLGSPQPGQVAAYQFSLRGEMSHFHFC